MKKALLLLILFVWLNPLQAEVITVNVPAPDFSLQENSVETSTGHYTSAPGLPKLPCRRITVAVPPDAVIESVEFHGNWEELAMLEVAPQEPFLPLTNRSAVSRILDSFEERKSRFYSSKETYPDVQGEVLAKGKLRKYKIVELACYHFAYKPSNQTVYHTPTLEVEIQFSRSGEISEHDREFMNDTTFDEIAQMNVVNWDEAQGWYAPREPRIANGYVIILPSSIRNSVRSLVDHRKSQAYNVRIKTVEDIEATIQGDDLPQKIRNYLRQSLPNTQYVLLVGTMYDVPMRELVPFNNDPNSPYNDPDVSPIPSDFYYSELSSPDNVSWNSDGDNLYGEVYDQEILFDPDDNPEYFADVHLARIPYRTPSYIEDICQKIIAFDTNTDLSYKTSSLLTGGMIYFERENYSEYSRMDGADMMEQIMDEGILARNKADYLYEEEGLDATSYPCTAPLSQANTVNYWSRKGIVLEYNHGARSGDYYAGKVWSWDDGDGIAESPEITWPMGLGVADVYDLDNEYPATTFLRSCELAKPEVDGLAKYMLYRGASSVFASTRILWASRLADEGMGYHFLKSLMKETSLSKGIVGKAFDISRIDFMEVNDFWINVYLIHHYGDPALRQFGRVVNDN